MLAAIAQSDPFFEPYDLRADLKEGAIAAPREATTLAWLDAKFLGDAVQFSRYVWVMDWIPVESAFGQVALVANSTFSRTTNIIQPVVINEESLRASGAISEDDKKTYPGTVLRIDLLKFAADPSQLAEIVGLYELLAEFDSFFNVSVPAVPPLKRKFAAAAYLNPEGAELFQLTHSDVPIMRLDEWVAFTFSSVNGGLYYKLSGVKDTLVNTVKEFAGSDAAAKVTRLTEAMRQAQATNRQTGESLAAIAPRLNPELAKTKALIKHSGVTGRQRQVVLTYGSGTAPATGPQLVAVTLDISEDNTDPNSDPQRNALKFETYNGGEAILAMPNGMLLYLVFDAQDKIIASVPDNVAHDFRARDVRSNVATARVFAGVSCANCHDAADKNWGWQPIVNDLHSSARRIAKTIDDAGARNQIEAIQTLASQYGASTPELTNVLNQSRLSYQFRASLATNHKTTRETVAGLADSYWGYWYDQVTSQVAARDLGQSLAQEPAQLFLINKIEPKPVADVSTVVQEDVVLADLKDGLSITPAQWRFIYQSTAERLLYKPAQEGIAK